MSFLLGCCFRVELEEHTSVLEKPRGKLNARNVQVKKNDPIPIPVNVQEPPPSSYHSFRDEQGITGYCSDEASGSSTDEE